MSPNQVKILSACFDSSFLTFGCMFCLPTGLVSAPEGLHDIDEDFVTLVDVELPIDDGQTEMDEEQTLALESTEE
jgi:hypothetical protein